MSAEQIAFQITYASVDSGDGEDPTAAARRILRSERVLAALREFSGEEAVLLIPVTESGHVVALDEAGLLRFDLSVQRLRELFSDDGLSLHLGFGGDALDAVDAELDDEFGAAFEQLDDLDESASDLAGFGMLEGEELDADLFAEETVRVAEFSRRGPWAARVTAQILGTDVDYLEAGSWSLYRYDTDRPHMAISGSRADGPIIEVNVPTAGDAWVEVTSAGHTAMFWPNSERCTTPVLDIEEIETPESAELYRRMLAEADGTRDELNDLGMGITVDADAVQRACMPEAVGGVAGETARLHAFVAAFGVPAALIEAALDDGAEGRRFAARGWMPMIGSMLMGGIAETTPLTRRSSPLARISSLLRKRPVLHAALSVGELSAGVALSRSRSRAGRGVGALLVIDAVVDLTVLAVRILRR
ncbi:hypothetical protein FM104_06415 [Microbacterium esteraromaticum]|uniref:Uncharacterized protein n=1 Tax=Microbacterium esteraromaticum TaxID=57043 RepID=A0A1R4JB21_9MICO|nr:hypothetical protein [Microbacterium esteraromaticum]SJN29238.1 hypothetical protein FM104_06415 [Microbacterium esteraromaticum]